MVFFALFRYRVGPPHHALAYANEASPLPARLAIGERIEVGFLARLSAANMASGHRGG